MIMLMKSYYIIENINIKIEEKLSLIKITTFLNNF